MKLDFKIFAIIGIHTVEPCENTGKESCFLNELVEPDHFAEWDCSSPEFLGAVPYGAECALVCEKDYVPIPLKLRTVHQCGTFGWENPESLDMICDYNSTKLQEDILTYWREHQGFNAVKLIKDPTLYNPTFDDNTVSGAYNLTINGNYGFLCDYARTLDQHAANLLCLSAGYSKAMEGNGTGWFHQDPGIELSDLHIQVAHVKCDSSATSITDCTSGGWGRGLGDNQGCTQKDIAWLSCEV